MNTCSCEVHKPFYVIKVARHMEQRKKKKHTVRGLTNEIELLGRSIEERQKTGNHIAQ